jgi:DNA-directed RNA polymerase specialized sigma24 family protein
VQNCSLLAFSKLPAFKHEGAFRSWLARILFNEAVSILRQRRHQASGSVEPISFEQSVAVVDGLLVGDLIRNVLSSKERPRGLSSEESPRCVCCNDPRWCCVVSGLHNGRGECNTQGELQHG